MSGERVSKSNMRVEAYGVVDELNSVLGALLSALPDAAPEIGDEIHEIQSDLLHVGAWLATEPGSPHLEDLHQIGEEHSKRLEGAIERMNGHLSPLTGFILPGGHPSACWAHLARTTCRRAERRVVRLSKEYDEGRMPETLSGMLAYLNRLSDYLFVLARYCNMITGVPDRPWEK